jgi:hypothetical protein
MWIKLEYELGHGKMSFPEVGEWVLVTDGKEIEKARFSGIQNITGLDQSWYVGDKYDDLGGTFTSDIYTYTEYFKKPTHWMPLPDLPNE